MTSSEPTLGLRRGTTAIRDYDPRWADEFRREEMVLRQTLGSLCPA